MDGPEISNKIKSAIKAKLVELGAYVDDELPEYIMVMVLNKKTQKQMDHDLEIFLHSHTAVFSKWLFAVLDKLKKVTKVKKSGSKSDKKEKKKKVKKASEEKEKEGKTLKKSTDTVPAKDGDSEKKKVDPLAVALKSVDKKKKEKKKKLKPKEGIITAGGEVKKSDPKSSKKIEKALDDAAKTKPISSTDPAKDEVREERKKPTEKSKEVRSLEKGRKPETKRTPLNDEIDPSKKLQKSKIVADKKRSESRDSISDVEMPTKENADKRRKSDPLYNRRTDIRRSRSAEHRSKDRRGSDRSRSPITSAVHRPQRRSPERRGGYQRLGHDNSPRRRLSRSPPAQYRQDSYHRDERYQDNRQKDDRRHGGLREDNFQRDERYQDDRRQDGHRQDNYQRGSGHRRQDNYQRNERQSQKRQGSHDRRSSSGERKKPTLMSSVGAVVNHESDDEYNPIRMLKKSMASTIQVPKPITSSGYKSRSDKPVESAGKSLILKAVQEADNSIKRKKQEELEREAQLEEIRRKREQKLEKLRSKGIGKRERDVPETSKRDVAGTLKPDVTETSKRNAEGTSKHEACKSENRDTGTEERKIRRVSFSDDMDDELENKEMKSTKNKKNFVIEIKNRVEPSASKSSEDLRVRLDKRRHVVRRPSQNDEIVVRKPSRNDDVVIRKLSQSDVDTESPPGSPPVKIVKIDEERHPDSSDDYDKDLMEMRRRALESMARGKLAPTNGAKKIIVPLNDESSSDSSSSDDSSSDSSSDDDSASDVSLSSTENEEEQKKKKKDETTFVVTLDGIDSAYFRSKARPSQTNSQLMLLKNRYSKKEEEDPESPKKQERGIEGPITVEQRKNISVPVLAAVGGGSGRTDPKNNDSVYRAANKKPEAKVAPTVKVEKKDVTSSTTESPKKENDSVQKTDASSNGEPPKKVRKRIEAPVSDGKPIRRTPEIPKRVSEPAKPIHRPLVHRVPDYVKPVVVPTPKTRPAQCSFWPNCIRGTQCLFYHPPAPVSLSTSNPDKYRWSSFNAPV